MIELLIRKLILILLLLILNLLLLEYVVLLLLKIVGIKLLELLVWLCHISKILIRTVILRLALVVSRRVDLGIHLGVQLSLASILRNFIY